MGSGRVWIASALLLVNGLLVAVAHGDEQPVYPQAQQHDHQHDHATTVCIEIRPPGRSSAPTKVCGPVVHGGQPQLETQQQAKNAAAFDEKQMRQAQMTPFSGVEAQALQNEGDRSFTFGQERLKLNAARWCAKAEATGGPVFQPSLDEMMLMQPGFRQAGPPLPPQTPCEHNQQRSAQQQQLQQQQQQQFQQQQEQMMRYAQIQPLPMGRMPMAPPAMIPAPPMIPPMGLIAPGMPVMPHMRQRSWLQGRNSLSSEELDQPKSEQQKSEEDTKKRLQTLLEECEDKTKIIKEKEAQIQQLLSKIDNPKRENEKPITQQMSPQNTVKTQVNKH